jgi:hypothetical protein
MTITASLYIVNCVRILKALALKFNLIQAVQCTDKKEMKIFLIRKEIQKGSVASHIWLTASSHMVKYLRISSYIRKSFLIYDFATDQFNFLTYEENFVFFLSLCLSKLTRTFTNTGSLSIYHQGNPATCPFKIIKSNTLLEFAWISGHVWEYQ